MALDLLVTCFAAAFTFVAMVAGLWVLGRKCWAVGADMCGCGFWVSGCGRACTLGKRFSPRAWWLQASLVSLTLPLSPLPLPLRCRHLWGKYGMPLLAAACRSKLLCRTPDVFMFSVFHGLSKGLPLLLIACAVQLGLTLLISLPCSLPASPVPLYR